MKKQSYRALLLFVMCLAMYGCGSKQEQSSDSTTEVQTGETVEESKPGLFDATYSAKTSITYSTGADSNWSYGNQRKEFPGDKPCYARISSTVITDKSKGENNEIIVIYQFTMDGNCDVDVSEGIAELVEDEEGIIRYQRTIGAKREKNAEEDIIVFRYTPNGASEITIDVIYDNQVAAKDDKRNTIYFDKVNTGTDNGIH